MGSDLSGLPPPGAAQSAAVVIFGVAFFGLVVVVGVVGIVRNELRKPPRRNRRAGLPKPTREGARMYRPPCSGRVE